MQSPDIGKFVHKQLHNWAKLPVREEESASEYWSASMSQLENSSTRIHHTPAAKQSETFNKNLFCPISHFSRTTFLTSCPVPFSSCSSAYSALKDKLPKQFIRALRLVWLLIWNQSSSKSYATIHPLHFMSRSFMFSIQHMIMTLFRY